MTSEKLSHGDYCILHRYIGNMIFKRVYYQLITITPSDKQEQYHEHNDRYEQVLSSMVMAVINNINKKNTDNLPTSIFIKRGKMVVGIKDEYRNEQEITIIVNTFLGAGYNFRIERDEVSFDFNDPHYR